MNALQSLPYDADVWEVTAAMTQDELAKSLRYAAGKVRRYLEDGDISMYNSTRNKLMTDESQLRFVADLVQESPEHIPMATAWLSAAERMIP